MHQERYALCRDFLSGCQQVEIFPASNFSLQSKSARTMSGRDTTADTMIRHCNYLPQACILQVEKNEPKQILMSSMAESIREHMHLLIACEQSCCCLFMHQFHKCPPALTALTACLKLSGALASIPGALLSKHFGRTFTMTIAGCSFMIGMRYSCEW